MSDISLPEGLPNSWGLLAFCPETAKPLFELAQILLQETNTLSPVERELIATYVSSQNDCYHCQIFHGSIAAHHLGGDEETVLQVNRDFERAPVSDKLKALLAVADKVQRGGNNVLTEDIARPRQQGSTDLEIHDTVLIAAAFCMYNRYVDVLATWAPTKPETHRQDEA